MIRFLKFTILLILSSSSLVAEEMSDATLRNETNLLWMCIAAFLVFFMQAGFAFVEAGFTRAKNAVNILMKNVSDFSVGGLAFFLFGFGIMFGPHILEGLGFGTPLPFSYFESTDGKPDPNNFGFMLFQMVFCGTAATISSGAMAERTKFHAYLIYSLLASGFVYPVFGSLAWSNLFNGETEGLLVKMGFIDFAGSTVVHSVGAWLGLAGTIVLGPRLGKYRKDGKIIPIFGHNMSMAALGMFILWFGWYGFNPGSTVAVDGGAFAFVAVTTTLAACAGALGSMFLSWALFKRPDISMVINGALAGLVAITAPCYDVDPLASIVIGFVAGIIVVGGVILLDHLHVDDPVGAVSVHGFAGAWGTLSVGLFAHPAYGSGSKGLFYGGDWSLLGIQAAGVSIAFVWALSMGLLIAFLLKFTIGLRVSEEEEIEGLDILEHGNEAYPEQV